jgi:hypothetical protein
MMRQSSHASTASASASSPRVRLGFFSSKKRLPPCVSSSRDDDEPSEKIFEVCIEPLYRVNSADRVQPQHSDKILSSSPYPPPFESLEQSRSYGLPSPDSFVGATHDAQYNQIREHIRKIRKTPVADPKKASVVWEVYGKHRVDAIQICKDLVRKCRK